MKTINKTQQGNLPNLIIIGAMKSGTSSLHSYLDLHPQILMSSEKELRFFSNQQNWCKGTNWYKLNFKGEAQIYGESSPQYTYYPYFKDVPAKIYSVVPDVKLIYVLRDPIKRIVSHYMHWYAAGVESRSLLEAFQDLESDLTQKYLWYSKYFMQLEQYLQYFKPENILVLSSEELYNDRLRTLSKVFKFLNVGEDFSSPKFYEIHHQSDEKKRPNSVGLAISKNITSKLPLQLRYRADNWLVRPFANPISRPSLNQSTKDIIMLQLNGDVQKLRKYTGHVFEEWCI